MPMLANLGLVLVKIEGTPGTDASPAPATDALLVAEPQVTASLTLEERNNLRPDMSPEAGVAGRNVMTFTCSHEIRGSGAAGTPPAIGKLLRACGYAETINAGTSVVYSPVSTGFESATAYVYYDGLLHKLVGLQGTATVEGSGGQRVVANFTMTGRLKETPTDVAIAAGAVYESTVPPILENASLAIDSDAMTASSISIDLGNDVQLREDVNSPEGYQRAMVVGRAPIFTMDPEVLIEATHPFWGNFLSGAQVDLSVQIGATAGNICTITAPKAQYSALSPSARNGIRIYDASMRLARSSGNDELVFTFT